MVEVRWIMERYPKAHLTVYNILTGFGKRGNV
jgi:hypothetical protein